MVHIQTQAQGKRLTITELLEAMFSLLTYPKLYTEDNPEIGRPKNNCVGECQQKFARQLEGRIT
jgi:hypothetical protein